MRFKEFNSRSFEGFPAKCGAINSKLLITAILAIFLISVSYVFLASAISAPTSVIFNGNSTEYFDNDGNFSINWTAASGAGIYYIYNSTDGGATYGINFTNSSVTGYYVSGAANGQNFTFIVQAVNATNSSDAANVTSAWMYVDTAAPAIIAVIQNGTVVSNKQNLTLNMSVTDAAGSGVAQCKANVGYINNITVAAAGGWCNLTGIRMTDIALGTATINIWINDSVGNTQYNTSHAIVIGGPVIPGTTQWNTSAQGPSLNLSAGDDFFYDGNTVSILANFTTQVGPGPALPYDNLTVTANATSIGDSPGVAATALGGGLYRINALVNYSNVSGGVSQFAGAPITLSVWNTTGGQPVNLGQPLMVFAVLVNMSSMPGCPPNPSEIPPFVFWNGTVRPVANCTTTCTGSNPIEWANSTHVSVCGPTFGLGTTNFSAIAQSGNFSAVPLVIDVPGKAKINFSLNPVDMSTQQKAGAIMQFAMKNLMSRGQFGINESEWNGQNNKPNLNASATLTMYNVSSLISSNHYSIGYGSFSGMDAPNQTSGCPASRCSGISLSNGNLTFTVSSFSSYVIGPVNYTLNFANLTSIRQSVNESVNATYSINISNAGNNTNPVTYNLSVQGIGKLNASQITLNSTSMGGTTWVVVWLNVSNATSGAYNTSINAVLSDDASVTHNSSEDGLGGAIITTVLDTVAPVVSIAAPASGALFNYVPYINGTVSESNLAWIKTNSSYYAALDSTSPFNFTNSSAVPDGTYIINVSANDTTGNVGWANVTFTIDTTRPAITIQSPANTTYNTTSVWFNITGSETLNWSAYSLDGAANISMANESGNWNNKNASMAEGSHTAVFWINDTAGNVNSTSKSFTIDLAPAVTGGLATPASAIPGAAVRLNATVADSFNVSQVFVNLSGIGLGALTAMTRVSGTASNGVYEYNLTVPEGYSGAKTFLLRANDTSGNTNSTESISFTISNAAPAVTVRYPNGSNYVKGTIIVNATVTDSNDNGTITNVTFYYTTDGSTYNFIGWRNTTPGNQLYNVSWDTSALNLNNVTIFVNATDGTNWTNDASDAVFVVDNAAPAFSEITTNTGSVYAGGFNFSVTITEPYFLSANYTITNATDSSIVWASNTTGITSNGTFRSILFGGIYLPVGNWTIIAGARDSAGNANTTSKNITSYPAIQAPSTYDGRVQAPGTIGSGTPGIYNFTVYAKGYPYVRMYLNLTSGSDKFVTAGNILHAKLSNITDSVAIDDEGSYGDASTLIIRSSSAYDLPAYATENITAGIYSQAVQLYLYPYSGLSAGTYSGNFGFGVASTFQ